MSATPGQQLVKALVGLSDTLVADFDLVEFLHLLAKRCAELLDVRAAGIMIADRTGALRLMAASSEQARLLELFEIETAEGPCVVCYASGLPVADVDLDAPDERWSRFAAEARLAGFRSVHAVPMRLRDEVIGVLNLFAGAPGTLGQADAETARALANVTTVGLLQHRAIEYRQVLAEQVQHAMNSRVTIEQAKGVLAEHFGLDMAAAFDELRRLAAVVGMRLSEVATAVTANDHAPPAINHHERLRMLLAGRFDGTTVSRLRAAVGAATARHGLSNSQVSEFVLAVHEAAANAVRHGGGAGQILLWLRGGDFYAEVSDHGPGIPAGDEVIPPGTGDSFHGGRGLWLIGKVCAGVEIDTGPAGTRLLLRYPLSSGG